MGTTDRFSRDEVQRILGLSPKQLDDWDRLELVSARKDQGNRFYDFRDLIALRTVKQLIEQGIPARRLRRALAALREKLSQVQAPLTELRVLSDGKDVIVERQGVRLEPVTGQFVMNFETRQLDEEVHVISERGADEWFALALDYEADRANRKTWAEAIDAYEHALRQDPQRTDALINCGTLYYEQGNFEKAAECYLRAIDSDPQSGLAHFNLGSVLEEKGQLEEARQHLRLAVRLDPSHPDARYNLALVCEKVGAFDEAREHWQAYLQLDPASPWSDYARQRLAARTAKSVGRR